MSNGTISHIGELEELLLLAVMQVSAQGDAYGTPIRAALANVGRRIAIGTLYVTLERLEEKGLVESWMGEAKAERGGRAKRLFRLTGRGVETLRAAEARRLKLKANVDLVGGLV